MPGTPVIMIFAAIKPRVGAHLALGPMGPMGPMGTIGPMGPMGTQWAHGDTLGPWGPMAQCNFCGHIHFSNKNKIRC